MCSGQWPYTSALEIGAYAREYIERLLAAPVCNNILVSVTVMGAILKSSSLGTGAIASRGENDGNNDDGWEDDVGITINQHIQVLLMSFL